MLEILRTQSFLLIILAWISFFFVVEAFGQPPCKAESEESYIVSGGANEVVELWDIRTIRVLTGRVVDPNGQKLDSAILDIFPANGLKKRVSASEYIDVEKRINSYHVDPEGAFCISDLAEGEYIVRFGSEFPGFNHTLITVRIKKSGSKKPITIWLTLGT